MIHENDFPKDPVEAVAAVDDAIAERLEEARTLTRGDLAGDDLARFEAIEAEVDQLRTMRARFAKRAELAAGLREGRYRAESGADGGGPHLHRDRDPAENIAAVTDAADLRARAAKAIERDTLGTDAVRESAARIVEATPDPEVARWAVLCSTSAYERAFSRVLSNPTHGHMEFTAEEGAAFRAVQQWRAVNITTPADGSLLVPTHLDPAVINSSDGQVNPFRQISRVVTLTDASQWNGVSSPGISMSFATEFAVVAGQTPVFSAVNIPVHRQHGFVAASFEAIQDVSSLNGVVGSMFADAVADAESQAFTTGTGTNEPTGIVTSLVGTAAATNMATNGTFALADAEKAQRHLAPRYRPKASWTMALENRHRARGFGDSNVYSGQTVDGTRSGPAVLLDRPVFEASYMDADLTATTNNSVVFGDFDHYVIVDRVGTSVAFIPHLFDQATGNPYGAAGWYAFRRVGAEASTTNAFTLLFNPNTAFTV